MACSCQLATHIGGFDRQCTPARRKTPFSTPRRAGAVLRVEAQGKKKRRREEGQVPGGGASNAA